MEKRNSPVLESSRLVLRPFEESDLPAFFEIFSDPVVNRFLPWFPLKSMEEAEAFWRERYALSGPGAGGYHEAVCLKEDNLPIGYVNLGMEDGHDLGYGLRREFWYRGIITEACRILLRRAAQDGIPYVTATHDRQNPRSGLVMVRLGMRYCYSYREQWQPKNLPVVFRLYQLNLDGQSDRVYEGYRQRGAPWFVEKNVPTAQGSLL